MAKKMCNVCGKNPATVPDRNRLGRPINKVCSSCHALLLKADFARIAMLRAARDEQCGVIVEKESGNG